MGGGSIKMEDVRHKNGRRKPPEKRENCVNSCVAKKNTRE